MSQAGKFLTETIHVLSKRAALLCSNPECGILTTGPMADSEGAVNIGEAAHIYGRLEGAARYDQQMTPAQRADITNGIWLCRNCHKTVDADAQQFPAELLFEWRRAHEKEVLVRLGKKNEILRDKLKTDHLRAFETASYLAQQIVLDRPVLWEYKLTAELLRTELGAVHQKWSELKNGFYARPASLVSIDQITDWVLAKFDDLIKIISVFEKLINEVLPKSWGPSGTLGNDLEILRACRLVVSSAQNLLDWEETIRFSKPPKNYEDLVAFLRGVAGAQLDELMKLPAEFLRIFSDENASGVYQINLIFKLPENFSEDFSTLLKQAIED